MQFPTARLSVILLSTVLIALAAVSSQAAILFVSNTQDFGAGSLRGTVAAAVAVDTIVFNIPTSDPGYSTSTGVFTITLTVGEIVVDKDLTITGPSAANIAISLELYDGNGQLVAVNDNWRDTQEAEIIATGIPPSNDLESAIVGNFAAGNYTAVVRGTDNTTGIALVEVYNLN